MYCIYKMKFLASTLFNLWANFYSGHEANYVTSLMSRFDGMRQNMDLMYRIIGVCQKMEGSNNKLIDDSFTCQKENGCFQMSVINSITILKLVILSSTTTLRASTTHNQNQNEWDYIHPISEKKQQRLRSVESLNSGLIN